MSIARRSVVSALWNTGVSMINVVVLFARSALLARLLPIEVFGIYAFAGSIVTLSIVVAQFGMSGAFLHRAPETEDEDHAAAIHFTLKCMFLLVWASVLVASAFLFTSGPTRTALLLLTATTFGLQLAQTPRLILTRRVEHRRLAMLRLAMALVTTLVALGLAWKGATLWALLSTDLVSLALTILVFYVVRPVWRPHLAWSPQVVRYFLRFGSRNFLAEVLLQALDRMGDLWTGIFLGQVPLGYYSRAYVFATYPRRVLAMPINMVAGGTYAELKGKRLQLSQAFFRTNALLVRSGFFLAGLLALVAPEFIRLILGDKWLPMLVTFRLMLVLALVDPIKVTLANLFVAVGKPELVVKTRLWQLLVLLVGLFPLGWVWGIVGVAVAMDAMLVVGTVTMLWQAKTYVDFSPMRLFAAPGVALALGILLGYAGGMIPGIPSSDWWTAIVKGMVYVSVFGMVLFALERQALSGMFSLLLRSAFGRVEKEIHQI